MNAESLSAAKDLLKQLTRTPRALRSEQQKRDINQLKKIAKPSSRKSKMHKSHKQKSKPKKLTPYQKYLQSTEWAQLKIDIYAARGRACQKCGSKLSLQIHHLHYRNIFKEEPEDLIILCRACHRHEHGIKEKV